MGSSKSKPVAVVASARQVLAKRKADAEALAARTQQTSPNTHAHSPAKVGIDVRYNAESALKGKNYVPDIHDIDADMVKEMSKWDLFSSTNETQVLDKNAKNKFGSENVVSAAILRINEEKAMDKKMAEIERSNIENNTNIPLIREVEGRVSELKLITMYHKFRDDPNGTYTTQQAAEEFGLSEESVKVLIEIARRPILVVDKSVQDLLVAK